MEGSARAQAVCVGTDTTRAVKTASVDDRAVDRRCHPSSRIGHRVGCGHKAAATTSVHAATRAMEGDPESCVGHVPPPGSAEASTVRAATAWRVSTAADGWSVAEKRRAAAGGERGGTPEWAQELRWQLPRQRGCWRRWWGRRRMRRGRRRKLCLVTSGGRHQSEHDEIAHQLLREDRHVGAACTTKTVPAGDVAESELAPDAGAAAAAVSGHRPNLECECHGAWAWHPGEVWHRRTSLVTSTSTTQRAG